jgi:hypothetical protein
VPSKTAQQPTVIDSVDFQPFIPSCLLSAEIHRFRGYFPSFLAVGGSLKGSEQP